MEEKLLHSLFIATRAEMENTQELKLPSRIRGSATMDSKQHEQTKH